MVGDDDSASCLVIFHFYVTAPLKNLFVAKLLKNLNQLAARYQGPGTSFSACSAYPVV